MAKRRTDSNRRDLATWLMMLLPGFMFVGLFAPAAVKVKPKAQEEVGPISFRNFAPRRPIQFALPTGHSALSAGVGSRADVRGRALCRRPDEARGRGRRRGGGGDNRSC